MQIHIRNLIPDWLGLMSLSVMLVVPVLVLSEVEANSSIAPTSSLVAQSIANKAESDVLDVATANGLTNFVALLAELGMAEDFRGYGRFTVFAPTNAAFEALPESVRRVLLNDRELLAEVLAYHAIASQDPIFSRDISGRTTIRSLQRDELVIQKRAGDLWVNGVEVSDADIAASNGVIHVIDRVLIPDSIMEEIQNRR
jgi:uncharacterized surface protein with fasciclin (FAS1) repeats